MIKVGLTGNRYSGKDTICKLFSQIGIPIFQADTVLKFILTHDIDVQNKIKKEVGSYIFKDGQLHPESIVNQRIFDDVVNCAESELMNAWNKFCEKRAVIYAIFHSSLLFERKWEKKMDYTINIFCPKTTRMERMKIDTGLEMSKIAYLLRNEPDDLAKNRMANFVVHSYYGSKDTLNQVNEIDQDLIDIYIKKGALSPDGGSIINLHF